MREPPLHPGWLCVWRLGFGPTTALQTHLQKSTTGGIHKGISVRFRGDKTTPRTHIVHAQAHNANVISNYNRFNTILVKTFNIQGKKVE